MRSEVRSPHDVELFEGRFRVGAPDEWYRLVTSGFLHFGIVHLGMNMFFLYILGNEVEPMLGRVKFGLLYAASLLGGSAGVMLFELFTGSLPFTGTGFLDVAMQHMQEPPPPLTTHLEPEEIPAGLQDVISRALESLGDELASWLPGEDPRGLYYHCLCRIE